MFDKYRKDDQDDKDVQKYLGFLYHHGYGVKTRNIHMAIQCYTKAARQDSADAQYQLGYLYEHSQTIKFKYKKAIEWYTSAAKNGNSSAQISLAVMYQRGLGTEKDDQLAMEELKNASVNHNVLAYIQLAKIYRKGIGIGPDNEKAAAWYQMAAKKGNKVAQNCLELLQQNMSVKICVSQQRNEVQMMTPHKSRLWSKVKEDVTTTKNKDTLDELKKTVLHALKGDHFAMFTVGLNYYTGQDFKRNEELAFRWILKAAQAGCHDARFKLAEMYEKGDCMEQNNLRATVWYRKLAKKGDDKALFKLGYMYHYGLGVRRDPLEASKWYSKAIDKNNSDAQYYFGILRYDGAGIKQDTDEALEWFEKAALQKNIKALVKLGEFYLDGVEKIKDIPKALTFLNFAAKNGNVEAQMRLGNLYKDGLNVESNLIKAAEYYSMASKNNHPDAHLELAHMHFNGGGAPQDYIKAYCLFKQIMMDEVPENNCQFVLDIAHPHFKKLEPHRILIMLEKVLEEKVDDVEYQIGSIYELVYAGFGNLFHHKDFSTVLQYYKSAAQKGSHQARNLLGRIYENGLGVKINYHKANKYYKSASELGNGESFYRLASMHHSGKGVYYIDLLKSYNLYTEAANRGSRHAIRILDLSYVESYVGNMTYRERVQLYAAAAGNDNIAAQYKLGLAYQYEDCPLKNYKESLILLKKASLGGMADAMYQVGLMYENGLGTEKDYRTAAKYYEKALDGGHDVAQYRLARFFHFGLGVERDYFKGYALYVDAADKGNMMARSALNISKKPLDYTPTDGTFTDSFRQFHYPFCNNIYLECVAMCEKVAENGLPELQFDLGKIYEEGIFLSKDYAKAWKWYYKASQLHYTQAIYRLGLLYEKGFGCRQSYKAAIELYNQAITQGSSPAQYRLGLMYQNGTGLLADYSTAIHHYIQSAEKGNSMAQCKLGFLYQEGKIVTKNILQSLKWYTLGYLQNDMKAEGALYNDFYYDMVEWVKIDHRKYILLLKIVSNSDESSIFGKGSIHYQLASMYLYGNGVSQNYTEAFSHFETSWKKYEYTSARNMLNPEYLETAHFVKENYLKRFQMYLEASKAQNVYAKYILTMIYIKGIMADIKVYNINGDSILTFTSDSFDTNYIIERNTIEAICLFNDAVYNDDHLQNNPVWR
jgi:TPR repeat protein